MYFFSIPKMQYFFLKNKWMIFKAVQIIENCNENDEKLILEEEDNFCRPTLFEFKMGMKSEDGGSENWPALPLFGRHFTNFLCTNIVKDSESEIALKKVFDILTSFFPDHLKIWNNEWDFDDCRIYRKDFVEVIAKDEFYFTADKVFQEEEKVLRGWKKMSHIVRRK